MIGTTLVCKLLNAWDLIGENQESGGSCFVIGTEQMDPNHMPGSKLRVRDRARDGTHSIFPR